MARSGALLISGPINAKHIGGVHVMSTQQSGIDSYFENSTLQPDTLPSHTYVAAGRTEVPRGPDTISRVIRRPTISIKRSVSTLSRKSAAQISELHHRTFAQQGDMSVTRTESIASRRPLRMQSSLSRLRQKVGLDKDLHTLVPAATPASPESRPERGAERVPSPIKKDYPSLPKQRSIPGNMPNTSHAHNEPRMPERTSSRDTYTSIAPNNSSVVRRMPSLSQVRALPITRKPSPIPVPTSATIPQVRSKRTDSGTVIDFRDLPVDERPLGFQEILSVPNYADRMRMYAKAREYWAHADHGLVAWTESASGPKLVTVSV